MRTRMTVGDLWGVLLRRWYVVGFAALCTLYFLVQVVEAKPVYWTQASVVFLRPVDSGTTNVLAGDEDSLIHFAAIVEREYNGNHPPVPTALPDATLFGEGVREGSKVSLPNAGGQWRTNFNEPVLTIQVVDDSSRDAAAALGGVLDGLEEIVASHQDAAGVSPGNYVTTSLSPSAPVITEIQPRTSRAVAATIGLGALTAVVLAVVTDKRLGRRETEPVADARHWPRFGTLLR